MGSILRKFLTCDFNKRKRLMPCSSSPTVYHAAVVIFLEFFAFGLITAPMISVLDDAFPTHTFLMNGLIQGIKGFLSFLSAPLIGSMSDIFGRKPFLFITVTFTCCPIPLIKLSHWWYFTMISISGIFAVTFSVVLAFVSDVTTVEDRTWAYGLVSATFAASLITSPALGAYLQRAYSENLVIMLATAVATLDILFILFCVPESLSSLTKRPSSSSQSSTDPVVPSTPLPSGKRITWDQVDPFNALRRMTQDRLTLIVCMTTFLSYLPEAGQYSCFFVYLRLVVGFSEENVALYIALCGLVSCIGQTCGLGLIIHWLGPKQAIIFGLAFEACQLAMFGFFATPWILWFAGGVAGLGSITYPALSAFLSYNSKADQQGLAQGLLTGIRGLCGGLGPAVYGFIFYIFQVDLNSRKLNRSAIEESLPPQPIVSLQDGATKIIKSQLKAFHEYILPGPPFAFGSILVILAIIVAIFIPEEIHEVRLSSTSNSCAHDFNIKPSDENPDDIDDEKTSFIGSNDQRRRPIDKRDRSSRMHRSSLNSHTDNLGVSFLQGFIGPINAHLPRLTQPRLNSKPQLVYSIKKLLTSRTRGARPVRSGSSSSDDSLRCLSSSREATEAADITNFRLQRMEEDQLSINREHPSETGHRLCEVQIGRRGAAVSSHSQSLLQKETYFSNLSNQLSSGAHQPFYIDPSTANPSKNSYHQELSELPLNSQKLKGVVTSQALIIDPRTGSFLCDGLNVQPSV